MEIPLGRYRRAPGSDTDLVSIDPAETGPFPPNGEGRKAARRLLKRQRDRLEALQRLLYADGSQALLAVFQAMDAGGKDGTIRRVMTGMNPQGVRVTSFKAPTEEELAHDFLWRINRALPRKGMIGVFNRSHYEDVLVVRVKGLVPEPIWKGRYDQINAFERRLVETGTAVAKFYLHISKEEQRRRLQARLDDPEKHWKFDPADLKERSRWNDYLVAYQDAMDRCNSEFAPWYLVPANHKWYRNVVIAQVLIDTLEGMGLNYPDPDFDPATVYIDG